MMMKTAAALVGLLAVAAVVASAADDRVLVRATRRTSPQWQWQHRCAPDDEVNLIFAVRQRNVGLLTQRLHEISDPSHPDYGEHLTFEQVGAWTRDDAALATLEGFLSTHAAEVDRTLNGDFVTARMSAAAADELFEAEFHAYKHAETGRTVFRTATYTMPRDVSDAVEYASRMVDFPRQRRPAFTMVPKTEANANGTVTPSLLQSYYHYPTTAATQNGATAHGAVFEALGQDYSPTYLATFQSQQGLAANPVKKLVGPNTPLTCLLQPNSCVEAQLDIEYINMAQGLDFWFWSIKSTDETPFVDWAVAVANTTDAPWVHSISYGGDEAEEPLALQQRFDLELQKLGARGISVVIASGDDGVAGAGARSDPSKCGFNPSFPATVPHATAVGATMGPETGAAETACTSDKGGQITTGGGFSGVFPQQAWQTDAIKAYMASGVKMPPSSMYNTTGRGYPDVAMMGHSYDIYLASQNVIGSGTSASTPVFAAAVALTNNMRVAAGKTALGFLNPALYKEFAASTNWLHDITVGENNCCAGPVGQADCCAYGFTAATGWDPLTGIGSVDFAKFSAVFSQL